MSVVKSVRKDMDVAVLSHDIAENCSLGIE
jgi:hypothetical protein